MQRCTTADLQRHHSSGCKITWHAHFAPVQVFTASLFCRCKMEEVMQTPQQIKHWADCKRKWASLCPTPFEGQNPWSVLKPHFALKCVARPPIWSSSWRDSVAHFHLERPYKWRPRAQKSRLEFAPCCCSEKCSKDRHAELNDVIQHLHGLHDGLILNKKNKQQRAY